MPDQIYDVEKTMATMLIRIFFILNITLLIMNSLFIKKLEWNLLPNYALNLLLVCHLFTTGVKLPGAMADFNRKMLEVASLNFREISIN